MDIIGRIVTHTSLNNRKNVRGKIIGSALDDIYVDISFDNDSVSSRKYELVTSFVRAPQLLQTDDIELLDYVKQLQSLHYCTNCEKYAKQLSKYDDLTLCSTCEKQICKCSACGRYLVKTSKNIKKYLNWPYCEECYHQKFSSCDCCGCWDSNSYMYKGPFLTNYQKVCWACASKFLSQCDQCKDFFPEENMHSVGSENLCHSCYATRVGNCKTCGRYTDHLKENLCCECWVKQRYISIFGNPSFFLGKREYVYGSAYSLRDTETIPFMSQLNGSVHTKVDMVILTQYLIYNRRLADLVIVATPQEIGNTLSEYGATITELKTDPGGHIRNHLTSLMNNGQFWNIDLQDGERFHLFHTPYHLRAMTYSDMKYGNGKNEYGDTSSFLIIGVLEK